eukprot:3826170-Prymnesium_polylepis.1
MRGASAWGVRVGRARWSGGPLGAAQSAAPFGSRLLPKSRFSGRQRITCDLASLTPRPYHVCTPPPRVRTSKTGVDLTQLTVSSRACGRRL